MKHWSCKMNVMSVGQGFSFPGSTTVNSSPVLNRLRASSSLRTFPGIFLAVPAICEMGVESGSLFFNIRVVGPGVVDDVLGE